MLRGRTKTVGVGFLAAQYVAKVAAFDWSWQAPTIQNAIQECQEVPIQVAIPLSLDPTAFGKPPYYFIALEEGGAPTVTSVGLVPLPFTWKADHKRGTNVILALMDSSNSLAGAKLYSMTSGSDASCIPSASQGVASVTSNVTGALSTCDAWGITIDGGKKPYTLAFSALNSSTIPNVRLQPSNNHYTYINRATVNGDLMVSVFDANGQWGKSSPILQTVAQDASCGGLESSESSVTSSGTASTPSLTNGAPSSNTAHTPSPTSTDPAHQSGTGGNMAGNSNHGKLIAGLVVGIGLLIIIAFGVIIWLMRKRNRTQVWNHGNRDILASDWQLPRDGVGMREVDATNGAAPPQWLNGQWLQSPSNTPFLGATPLSYFASTVPPSSFAGISTRWRSQSGTGDSKPQQVHILSPPIEGSTDADELQLEPVIQHRDAGVAQELPPPYAGLSLPQSPAPLSVYTSTSSAAAEARSGLVRSASM